MTRSIGLFLCLTIGLPAGLSLAGPGTPKQSKTVQFEPPEGTTNVAVGKKVTSLVAESRGYSRAASRLTDGNLKTDAYPGSFSLGYAVDLTTYAEAGNRTDAKGFEVDSIVIHWGHFGRHFPGTKREDGSWAPAAYKADYVNQYRIACRMKGAEDWKVIHTGSSMPAVEDAEQVVVTRDPPEASVSEGKVTTRLCGLNLRDVRGIKIDARGGHWIGIFEIKVFGKPSLIE